MLYRTVCQKNGCATLAISGARFIFALSEKNTSQGCCSAEARKDTNYRVSAPSLTAPCVQQRYALRKDAIIGHVFKLAFSLPLTSKGSDATEPKESKRSNIATRSWQSAFIISMVVGATGRDLSRSLLEFMRLPARSSRNCVDERRSLYLRIALCLRFSTYSAPIVASAIIASATSSLKSGWEKPWFRRRPLAIYGTKFHPYLTVSICFFSGESVGFSPPTDPQDTPDALLLCRFSIGTLLSFVFGGGTTRCKPTSNGGYKIIRKTCRLCTSLHEQKEAPRRLRALAVSAQGTGLEAGSREGA